jgi:hypothetical protein
MAPKLEKAFTLQVFLAKEDTLSLGPVKGGPHRYIAPLTHGSLEGSGVKAKIVQGGSDWLLLDPTANVAHLDVRTHLRTEGGDLIYVHYPGIVKMDEAAQKIFQWSPDAKSTKPEDHDYFMSTPTFETSSQSLKWIEQTLFIGQGHWLVPGDGSQAAEYDIYKVISA